MKQYNRPLITALINTVSANHGIGNKNKLAELCKDEFNLTRKGSVYFCDSFAIRFCSSRSQYMGNTVLALSALKKYDDRPFFVCIVTPSENYILLSNTTCLKKISHSSHNLRIDNIRGSFNGSDIMREIEGLDNSPQNFEEILSAGSSRYGIRISACRANTDSSYPIKNNFTLPAKPKRTH